MARRELPREIQSVVDAAGKIIDLANSDEDTICTDTKEAIHGMSPLAILYLGISLQATSGKQAKSKELILKFEQAYLKELAKE